jgi:hypothetical protein
MGSIERTTKEAMFHLLLNAISRPGGRTPRGVHFHLDDNGREFACHDWECNPANRLPHLRMR